MRDRVPSGPVTTAVQTIPLATARRLFLEGHGLLADTARAATPGRVFGEVERLGFVQLDSISVVERAHHHILWTRLHNYRPPVLDRLQRAGKVFEHWTHDASIIPSQWFPHWRHRFARVSWGGWLRSRMGADHEQILASVIGRIRDEGPLMARDFEHPTQRGGPWWNWKPAKAALEYWWRTGELAIPRRDSFQKVYDLTERVLPHVHSLPRPELDEHVDWACRSALDRLAVATARELACFWGLITTAQAAAWCKQSLGAGELVRVAIDYPEGVRPPSGPCFARPGWQRQAAKGTAAPGAIRLLSPFDPIIRDRARCLRLFGFDYRFEAFVPAPKRKYGYYVLPILRGDAIIGRLDPRLDRDGDTLHIRAVWWEQGTRPTRALRGELDDALHRYAAFAGASKVELSV